MISIPSDESSFAKSTIPFLSETLISALLTVARPIPPLWGARVHLVYVVMDNKVLVELYLTALARSNNMGGIGTSNSQTMFIGLLPV